MGLLVCCSVADANKVSLPFLSGQAGYYARITSLANTKAAVYKLASQPLPADSTHCRIDFYYFIADQEESRSTLRISVFHDGKRRAAPLWTSRPNGPRLWRSAWVNINESKKFVLVLEADFTAGVNDSVIAVDDISFRKCGAGELGGFRSPTSL